MRAKRIVGARKKIRLATSRGFLQRLRADRPEIEEMARERSERVISRDEGHAQKYKCNEKINH